MLPSVRGAYSDAVQVLHLLLCQLRQPGSVPDKGLMEFLFVDEHLVDIGDDLTDYEVRRCTGHMQWAAGCTQ